MGEPIGDTELAGRARHVYHFQDAYRPYSMQFRENLRPYRTARNGRNFAYGVLRSEIRARTAVHGPTNSAQREKRGLSPSLMNPIPIRQLLSLLLPYLSNPFQKKVYLFFVLILLNLFAFSFPLNTVLTNKIFLRVPLCEPLPHHQGVLGVVPRNGNRIYTRKVPRMCSLFPLQEYLPQ